MGASAAATRISRLTAVRLWAVVVLTVVVAGMLPPVARAASPVPATGGQVSVIVRADPAVEESSNSVDRR
jgi:hypothetical protein